MASTAASRAAAKEKRESKARAEQKERDEKHASNGYSKSDAAKARVENTGRTYGTSSQKYKDQKTEEGMRGYDTSKAYTKTPNFAYEKGDYIASNGMLKNANDTGDWDLVGQGIPTRVNGLAPYSGNGNKSVVTAGTQVPTSNNVTSVRQVANTSNKEDIESIMFDLLVDAYRKKGLFKK